jgi:hypothetical protein
MDADLQDEPQVLLEMYQILLTEKVDVAFPRKAQPANSAPKSPLSRGRSQFEILDESNPGFGSAALFSLEKDGGCA